MEQTLTRVCYYCGTSLCETGNCHTCNKDRLFDGCSESKDKALNQSKAYLK